MREERRIVKNYYVYILTNTANVLYIGVTSDLTGRFWEHLEERSSKFCADYNLDRLVYYEIYQNPVEAIAREKQLKGWRREKKLWLIKSINPAWRDLSEGLRT
jgi:putative endonuclease